MIWIWFGARRTAYAESILMANWDELSEETQQTLIKNKQWYYHASAAAVIVMIVNAVVLFQQLSQATGTQ